MPNDRAGASMGEQPGRGQLWHQEQEQEETESSSPAEEVAIKALQQPASPTGEDDKEESSSSDGKGDGSGGSGGGYSGDCSSSDTSSLGKGGSDGCATSVAEKKMTTLSIHARSNYEEDDDAGTAAAPKKKETGTDNAAKRLASVERGNGNSLRGSDEGRNGDASIDLEGSTVAASDPANQSDGQQDERQHQYNDGESSQDPKACLPQWNGIRIQHPMDPRIDLSTVGYVQTSQLQNFPGNVGIPMMDRLRPAAYANLEAPPHHDVFPFGARAAASGASLADSESLQGGESGELPPLPSMEQYLKLMESVRPFFYAHGLASQQHQQHEHRQAPSEQPSSYPTSSELPTGSSDSDQKIPAFDLLADLREPPSRFDGAVDWNNMYHSIAVSSTRGGAVAAADAATPKNGAGQPNGHPADQDNDTGTGNDAASLAVLARVKSKHKKPGDEDGPYHNDSTSTSNTNSAEWDTSNSGGSASSSEKRRVRIQHPPVQNGDDHVAVNDERDWNENSDEQERQVDVQHQQRVQQERHQQHQQDDNAADAGVDRQESSTSTSSSDGGGGHRGGNNDDNPVLQAAPLHYGVPAVVSEYSSSRNGSSGASNTNAMSTSGSGSGGNNTGSGTGSGTASGSNQGGSSGSGNDQGGMSSNGNGSSGSGNDVKGSSEENMDNSGENNSGENSGGNSDASNRAIVKAGPKIVLEAQESSNYHRHVSEPLHVYHHYHHAHCKDGGMPPPESAPPDHQGADEAVREKKIQDKKRKRMNMRREYEERVEQEMESSEGSQDREVLIRPGRPITLDKVLSFTKTPRLVVKADAPFLVVYTNAAYCRLSGIDSHNAVGKAISSLLALPDQYDLAQLDFDKEYPPLLENYAMKASKIDESAINLRENQQREIYEADVAATDAENHVAAEAAGRARAATSKEENKGVGLDRLVAASGFNRFHVIKVRSKPHHMLGRNVKFLKAQSPVKRSHDEGSNGSSISSTYDGPSHFAACTMSISPVVSSPEAYNVAVVTDSGHKHKRIEPDQDNHQQVLKRRKHHHHYHQNGDSHHHSHHTQRTNYTPKEAPTQRRRHLVSHYVIQLEPFDGHSLKFGGMDSQSSTSATVDAQITDRSKTETLQWQRIAAPAAGILRGENRNSVNNHVDDIENDEIASDVSEPKHVSAIA